MDNYQANLIDQGHLRCNVLAGNTVRPVPGATVTITPRGAAGKTEELVTDGSGLSPTVNLAAPPVEYSMAPDQPRPYSEYDLTITASGFETTRVTGVQIYPGVIATQNVLLVEQAAAAPETLEIVVPDNTLWGTYPPKDPEDPVKPLPDPEGLVVLPDPVIPEFIIVHAGTPGNKSAPDYWVPFKDYIKNVGSSEIYSTWPTETIKANVLAILSFTLNRVYTEWYRGKGYDFTITSSTAYDHAFSYGRTIYREISQVVDDIFNQYITKPGIQQPLLTQYCDGRQVKCPTWMTQWGSKDLGDQGYSAMEILRSFYGYDIYLEEATQVEGVPSSYPGYHLQVGSTGAPVRTIQTQLNRVAKNFPAIPTLAVDGIYGPATEQAVATFQEIFDLSPTGVVDFSTWYSISNIYVAVTRMAELRQ